MRRLLMFIAGLLLIGIFGILAIASARESYGPLALVLLLAATASGAPGATLVVLSMQRRYRAAPKIIKRRF